MTNIAACTQKQFVTYPAFISINSLPDQTIQVIVRSKESQTPQEIILEYHEWTALLKQMNEAKP